MVIISDPGSQGYPKIGNYTIPVGNREKTGKRLHHCGQKGLRFIHLLLAHFFSRFAVSLIKLVLHPSKVDLIAL